MSEFLAEIERTDLAPVRVIEAASDGARSAPSLRIRFDPTPSI
ncbi:hypothetical protein Pla163_04160 [Planctomycetes bacterium Pla163]|uniref:Uncharacterized protein n=1 Tax=Rohdeia mirabilis TaxID=2528008 RepID=A0A518CVU3_9BACT|nr:hypothetical protein Pla163_04160 [Planctomycetes bacterium Pla163]